MINLHTSLIFNLTLIIGSLLFTNFCCFFVECDVKHIKTRAKKLSWTGSAPRNSPFRPFEQNFAEIRSVFEIFASMEDVHGHWVRDRVRTDIKVEVLCFDKFCAEKGKYRTLEIYMSG